MPPKFTVIYQPLRIIAASPPNAQYMICCAEARTGGEAGSVPPA